MWQTLCLKALSYDWFLFAVPIPSLHSHASSVPLFNGMNFSDWWEQVQFHLGVLDLDLALQEEKLATIIDESSVEQKSLYKK